MKIHLIWGQKVVHTLLKNLMISKTRSGTKPISMIKFDAIAITINKNSNPVRVMNNLQGEGKGDSVENKNTYTTTITATTKN